MTIGDRGLARLSGSGLRPFLAGLLAVVAALIAGLFGLASAAAATPATEVESAAAFPMHGSGYGYDYHSESARPPAVQAEIGANDTVTNSAHLAARLGQVRRVLSDSEVSRVAPRTPSTFRGDTRSPSQIFDEGFWPVGDDLDLLRHAEGYPNSGYGATSRSPGVAADFGPNVYEVRAPGGIDVNAALGSRSPLPWALEIAYPGGVPSSCIVGCMLPSGQWVPNPGFGP